MEKILEIIKSVIDNNITKEKIDARLFNLANFHSLSTYLYPVMDNSNDELSKRVKEKYYSDIKKDYVQLQELNKILALFEKHGIDAIPLKGSVMKHFYPETFYRSMTDIDVLVRQKDMKKASKILKSLGYKAESNGPQHIEFEKKPFMVFELHRLLIPEKELGKDIFIDIFDRAIKLKGFNHIYKMSDEDFYLFMMCHLLKHYLLGGTGLRSFLDVYVYLSKKPNLDFDYIDSQLKKTKHFDQLCFIKKFSIDIFSDNELDDKEKEVLNFILTSGTYGLSITMANNELSENNGSAFKVVLKKIFPKASFIKNKYPVVKKCIILLPIFYVVNWFHFFKNFKHSVDRTKELNKLSKEKKKNL